MKHLMKLRNFPNMEIKTIYNGVNTNVFKATESDIKEKFHISGKMLLGVAAVWDGRKGLRDFVKLRERINKNDIIILVGLS